MLPYLIMLEWTVFHNRACVGKRKSVGARAASVNAVSLRFTSTNARRDEPLLHLIQIK